MSINSEVAPDIARALPILPEQPEDFLTPQQRLEALAQVLATIALRAAKDDQL